MVKTMVKQVVRLQSMEVHSGADIHTAAHGEPNTGASGCAPKEAVTLLEAQIETDFWQDLWPCGGLTLKQSIPEGLYPVEWTHAGANV